MGRGHLGCWLSSHEGEALEIAELYFLIAYILVNKAKPPKQ